MKTATISALLTVLLAGAALAEDKCAIVEKIARQTMEARQAGVPLAKMIEIAEGNQLLIEIAKEAYRRGAYQTAEYRHRMINEFANDAYLVCLDEN